MTRIAGDATSQGRAIDVELVTRAPADRVWDALTDPVRLAEWLADRVGGTVRPGAQLTWHFDALGSELSFTVDPATQPGRLLLRGEGGTPGRLEIIVGPAHDGTRIALLHHGLSADPSFEDDYRALSAGWCLALAVLRYYVEFQFGQARRGFFAGREIRCSPSRLHWLFHDPAGLREWFTTGGSMGTPGGRVHLVLRNDESLRGDMLADAGTDIAMAWDEITGVLQLRSLPARLDPEARLVCAVGWGWGIPAERARQVEEMLAQSLERLEAAADTGEGQGAAGLAAGAPQAQSR